MANVDRMHENAKTFKGESQREREFYRYFEPIRELTRYGPKFLDLNSDASVNSHAPVPSPDPALTAFCQLGALRCQTRRAMMFFFDKQYAYILAEATRSLSLHDASIVDTDDAVWLGHSKIPRGFSVCEQTTLHLQPQQLGSDTEEEDVDLVHIINDLREDTAFCDRPYVTGGPRARFYAGVPIRTERGINIGAFCVLDEKPRDGLKDTEMKFLRHMSTTIMQHLEMIRSKSQAQRASAMVGGLASFLDGATNESHEGDDRTPSRSQHSSTSSAPALNPDLLPGQANGSEMLLKEDSAMATDRRQSRASADTPLSSARTGTPQSYAENSSTDSLKAVRRAANLRAELVTSNVRRTFERAVGVLRPAMQLDGVMFVDASPSSYAGLVSEDSTDRSRASSTDESPSRKSSRRAADNRSDAKPSPPCDILAASYSPHPQYAHGEVGTRIDEGFLKKLLRRYPRGKIWNFSAEGISSSDDDDRDGQGSAQINQLQATQSLLPRRKKNRRTSQLEDGKRLAQQFPGVRSIAISGVYNQLTGRWQAASLAWTYDHYRSLQEDLELPFLKAFSDVLMVEIQRQEAQKSDRAKVDFISSISHELRSPLHGILGSVECIQEQDDYLDDFTSTLVGQVEVCGRNLLDIVNSLLDFSKINYYGKAAERRLQSDRQSNLSSVGPQLGSMMSLDAEVSLDVVTEEILDSTFYSFCCSQQKETVLKRKTAVILDIQRGADISWWCRITLGAWKRIVMNIVSNALKYTEEGYIHVSLKREGTNRRSRSAILTVKDTGQGMSRAFLQDRLFTAFAQENSFAEGTGLGMNLVATIVKQLGGKIEVQSEQHVGTTVIVQLPLEQIPAPASDSTVGDGIIGTADEQGLTVGMLSVTEDTKTNGSGGSPARQISEALLVGSVVKTCSELDIRTVSLSRSQQDADVLFATEEQISRTIGQHAQDAKGPSNALRDAFGGSRSQTPLVILCDSAVSSREFKKRHLALMQSRRIELISQPAGPERVQKAIRACLTERTRQQEHDAQAGAMSPMASPPCVSFEQETAWSTQLPHRGPSPGTEFPNGSSDPGLRTPLPNGELEKPKSGQPTVKLDAQAMDGDRPLAKQPAPATAPKSARPGLPAPKRTASATAPPSGITLLIVDDNAINVQLLTTYANKNGHDHIQAHNGQHAVDAYKAACTGAPLPKDVAAYQTTPDGKIRKPLKKPDIICMDISMPVMDGYEATRSIRAYERSHGLAPTTVVALTGLGSAGAQQEAYTSGVDLFLTKPVKLKELGKIIAGADRREIET